MKFESHSPEFTEVSEHFSKYG